MSGGEAVFVIGLISGVMSIFDVAKKVYDAARDSKDQPEAFRQVAARLPLVIEILRGARERAQALDETALDAVEQTLKSCKDKAEKLTEIFQKVIRKDDDKWYARYKTVISTSAKGHKVECLMQGILQDTRLLACEQLMGLATENQVKELEEGIREMNEMPSSLPDEAGSQTHSGSGDNIGFFGVSGSLNVSKRDFFQSHNTGPVTFGTKSIYLNVNTLNDQGQTENSRDKKELLRDLAEAAKDYERYKTFISDRVHGTCEWFLADERFHKWRDSESSSLLWLSARPGCGKSVLSKALIDGQLGVTTTTTTPSSINPANSTDSRQSTVCYFFFREGGDGYMDGAHALCALLYQLFTYPSTSGLIRHALESHNRLGKPLTRNFLELWQILSECAKSPDAGEIICVLDALDECKEYGSLELTRTLKQFYSQSQRLSIHSSNLKFLITSRSYDYLENSFKKFPKSVFVRFDGDDKSDQVSREIDLVIDARVKDITDGFTPEDREKISKRLKSMEHRTYLWLYLTLNTIETSPTEFGKRSDIEKLLSHLPSQVSDVYEKILSRSKLQSRTNLLLRIMLAAARPLDLDEANAALTLAIQEQEPTLYRELESELWPRDNFRSIVTNLCGLFINVYDSKLLFIHQTAREFLLDPKRGGNWKGRFNMPQSHSTMSRSCLFYLMLPDIGRPPAEKPAQGIHHPYLSYAATYWPLHFVSQEVTNANAFRRHARTLCNVAGHPASIWAPIYFNQRDLFWESYTDLSLASYLGLNVVVYDILAKEKLYLDTNENYLFQEKLIVGSVGKDSYDPTELSRAAEKDINVVLSEALYWTVSEGHEAVVKLLLKAGANPAAIDEDNQYGDEVTPLVRAAELGYVAILKLLLEKSS